jgi:ribosomal protein S8
MLTDPIADMLTRIRNANKALQEQTEMPTSRQKEEIARILQEEGYIVGYSVRKGESYDTLVVQLKYGPSRERIITDLKRVSKPGRRVYARKDRLGAIAVYMPADPEIGASEVPVLPLRSEPFVDDAQLLLREAHDGPRWPSLVAYAFVFAAITTILGLLFAGAVGLERRRRPRGARRAGEAA